MFKSWIAGLTCLVGAFGPLLTGPQPQVAPARVLCQPVGCAIALQRVVTLKSDKQPDLLPNFQTSVVRDQRGRFFSISRQRDQVLVFDSAGRFVSTIGRKGEAPGQFQRVSAVLVGPHDSLLVYDIRASRLTTFGADLKVATTARLSFLQPPRLALSDGRLVFTEHVRTPELIGLPIHVVEPSGKILRSFGAAIPQYRPDLLPVVDRVVGRGESGSLWSAPPGKYQLERWSPDTGQRLGEIRVASSWFAESTKTSSDERVRPMPLIEAVWQDGNVVWVLIRDADAAWKPPALANTERVRSLQEYYETYDWVAEAVDPASGRVLARRRFPQGIWARPGPHVVSFSFGSGFVPRGLEVNRMELVKHR